jgi:transposase
MDVHSKRTQIAVMDEGGHELFNENVPNDPARIADMLAGAERGTPVAFEATRGWSWLAELLEMLGLEPHLAHPAGCQAIASARLKNDRIDARTLAHLLRADLLPEAWMAPREVRELRALLRHRAGLVVMRTILKNRIRAVLADEGVQPPGSLWTATGREWLAELDLRPLLREIVDDDVGVIEALEAPIARIEREIGKRAKPDARVDALQALPGVGRLTGMTLVAEIGDVERFATARKLCAWAGLTPSVRNSDRKVHHGHITKRGPAPCDGFSSRRRTSPNRSRPSRPPTRQSRADAAPPSPPWRWPTSSWPGASTSSRRSTPPRQSSRFGSRVRSTLLLRRLVAAVSLTEQPGPD